ncbi:hypothetical protein POX_a00283 [Penicillium oxalicum]|uniref:hypothetical protein n=1 Tax=Penicillium oxalicum TaxID=69781 RepID=UPI0020B74506|nr:hypothetical protein POX_a00283 [Penicillium oxalicum]KAI2793699.1 hypothetical protein POX_a00283 [Penicillium oxalicum]
MEVAPLTLAHTHARSAVSETRKSNPVAASEEHDLAAGEFATAAQGTSDPEHEHPSGHPVGSSSNVTSSASSHPSVPETRSAKTTGQDAFTHRPRLPGNPRLPSRESSSIASNLASARGIPAQTQRGSPVSPSLSTQQAGAKMADGPSRDRPGDIRPRDARTHRQSWTPPSSNSADIASREVVPSSKAEATGSTNDQDTTEDSFRRFYSTFEGLISRISAPLAFAGLPLGTEETHNSVTPSRKAPADTKLDRHSATSDRTNGLKEPDVNQLFSRAALRSIHDMSGSGGLGKPAESFYVVPTTGGTMSYAGILSRAEKDAGGNSFEETEDDFVDARETPSSPEMRQSTGAASRMPRRGGSDKLARLQNSKTVEELQMENAALKQLSDTLSKRLHMWEVNAQSSSMALQQSLRAMHHHNAGPSDYNPQLPHASSSPAATLVSAPSRTDKDSRVKELEEIVRRGEQELDRVERENEKLNKVLGRYRDRWEKLKEGAKSRRAEGRPVEGPSNPGTPTLGHRNPDLSISSRPDGSLPDKTAPNRRTSGAHLERTGPSET